MDLKLEIIEIAKSSSPEEIVGIITTTKSSVGRPSAVLAGHIYRNSYSPDSTMGRPDGNLGQDLAFCRLSVAVVPAMVCRQPY